MNENFFTDLIVSIGIDFHYQNGKSEMNFAYKSRKYTSSAALY